MRLTLFVPGLLLPEEIVAGSVHGLDAPALSLILGRGQRSAPLELVDGWLPPGFIPQPVPAAALRKVGAGGTAPGEWLCLDPVHWRVSHEAITLDPPEQLCLSAAESLSLIAALQPLFNDWGELSASAPAAWELHLARPLSIETLALPAALDRPIDPKLPGGADGQAWRQLIATAQTLLHAHPVNQEREATGRSSVSSLWPWGAGAWLPATPRRFDTVLSNDPVLAGSCATNGSRHAPLPERFMPSAGPTLAVVDRVAAPARTLDALAWGAAVQSLEADWLAPALAALRHGVCRSLELIAGRCDGSGRAVSYNLDRPALLRFWRRPADLVHLT